MKMAPDEIETIKHKLEEKEELLSQNGYSQLDSSFKKFISTFLSFYNTLISENIIKEDPFRADNNLDDLEVPDQTEIVYGEDSYQMGIRLGHLASLLDYIRNNIEWNRDSLNLINTNKILYIINYIDWDMIFHPQPSGINTESLAKAIYAYQRDIGSKSVMYTLRATTQNLNQYVDEMIDIISTTNRLKLEEVKIMYREVVFPGLKLPPVLSKENTIKCMPMVKSAILEKKLIFHPQAIEELFEEDFSDNGYEIRQQRIALLDDMNSNKNKDNKPKPPTQTELFTDSLNCLANILPQLEKLILKIDDNSNLYRDEKTSLLEYIIDYIRYNILKHRRETHFILNVIDPISQKMKEKDVVIEDFIPKIKENINLLTPYKDKESDSYNKILDIGIENGCRFLHSSLGTSSYVIRHIEALDNYFKNNLSHPKGLQVEITTINSIISNAQGIFNQILSSEQNKS